MAYKHIAEINLNDQGTLKTSLDVSDCAFYNCLTMRLVQMTLLERDDSYLTEAEIKTGKTGWMSLGTHYFLPEQLEYAKAHMPDPKTFDFNVWRHAKSGLIRLHDLPKPGGFDYTKPFTTRGGWPCRLLGVLSRPSFPLVVAVSNPAFSGCEQVCFYNLDGRTPTTITESNSPLTDENVDPDIGAKDGALSLVNI